MKVHEQHNGHIRWLTPAKRVIIMTLTDFFTWDEAVDIMTRMNDAILTQPHSVFSLYHFEKRNMPIPNRDMISNLAKIMQMTIPNERLIVIVNHQQIQSLIKATSVVYGLLPISNHYRYAETLEEGIKIIEQYRATQEID